MSELRIQDAWLQRTPFEPELRIQEAWLQRTPTPPVRELRLHEAWVAVGLVQPVTEGATWVRSSGAWSKYQVKVRINGAWS